MKPITIAICDDEPIILSELKAMISELFATRQQEVTIREYHSGNELLLHINEINVVFLDISMPELDGIATGRLVMQKNRSCKIIMATSKTEYFKETFKINAFRFITKPFDKSEVEEALLALRNLEIGQESIALYESRNLHEIPQRDIAYITSYDSYVEAMVYGRAFRKETSLRELEEILDKRLFYRIQRRYIVNMQCISDYRDGNVEIDNMSIAVSRRKKKEFEKAYIEYDLMYR